MHEEKTAQGGNEQSHIPRLPVTEDTNIAASESTVLTSGLTVELLNCTNSLPGNLENHISSDSSMLETMGRDMLDSVGDAVFVVNSDLQLIDCNRTFRRWFVVDGEAVDCRSIFGGQFEQVNTLLIEPVAAGTNPGPFRMQIKPRNLQPIWTEVTAQQYVIPNSIATGYLFIIKDVSQLINAENEIAQMTDDIALINEIARILGKSHTFTDTLVNIKAALSTAKTLVGGRLLVYEPTNDLLWQGIAWGVATDMIFQPVSVPEFYKECYTSEPKISSSNFTHHESISRITSNYMSWCVPIVTDNDLQGIMELFSDSPSVFSDSRKGFYHLLGNQIGIIMRNAILYEEVKASRERLKLLSANLVSAVEAERRSLARDLHDEVGQALLALQLAIGLSSKENGGEQNRDIENQQYMVTELTSKIRGIITDMRPGVLVESGLVGGIGWLMNRLAKVADICFSFKYGDLGQIRFASDIETVLFRVTQEALNNIVKHAKADNVVITLEYTGETIILNIIDDGTGFDVYSKLTDSNHYGLIGMYERVEAINGTLSIDSSTDQGTKLTITATAAAVNRK